MNNNQVEFLITKNYRQFIELCNVCKEYSYIGLCYGTPGVGKTLSALRYTSWETIEPILPPDHLVNPLPVDEIATCDSIFYTVPVTSTPVKIEREINSRIFNLNWLIGDIVTTKRRRKGSWDRQTNYTKLIIIDEADRLKPASLEQVRDIYDKNKIGMVLIGMPGIEKRFSRYPQLYSRVGFVHNFKPIDKDEIHTVIIRKIDELGINYKIKNKSTKEAIAEIKRITRGNFRQIQRLFNQIDRIIKLNKISDLDKDVVDSAKESLILDTV